MKSIALGRMLLDGAHVTTCRYALDDAMLGARLKALGLDARLYAGKGEGRVVDLARQFARMRADAYVLFVEAGTLALMQQITRQLRLLLPALQVFFRGPIDEALKQSPALIAADIQWLPTDIEACAAALAARSGLDAAAMNAASTQTSPYLCGLVHEDELGRIGLSADQPLATFALELAWLARRPLADVCIPVTALTRSAAELQAIGELLRQSGSTARFALRTGADALAEASGIPYGINGVIALYTGLYGDANQAAGIRHLEVSATTDRARRQQVYAWAAPHMASRSALVLQQDAASADADRAAVTAPATPETSGWPMHSYVFDAASAGESQVSFDGRVESARQVRHVPLSQLASLAASGLAGDAGQPNDAGTLTFLSMRDAADADEFERRLRQFTEHGRLVVEAPQQQKYFENSCRWTRRGSCHLASLKRLQVHAGTRLASCRDAGDVGSTDSGYDEIVIQVKREQQMQGIRRECAVCPVRDDCSQCSQLPAEWGGRYCAIRKANPCASLFIELFSMAPGLAALFGVAAGAALELQVSHAGLPNQHFMGTANAAGAGRSLQRDGQRPVILSAHGKHVAWWRGSKKLFRLSGPMALMAEAWWSAGSDDEIVADLSTRFNVPSEVASSSLKTGVDKLRTEGIIHA